MAFQASWYESANRAETDFPLANLPCGVFSTASSDEARCGVAIGDGIIDMARLDAGGFLEGTGAKGAFDKPSWNALMARGPGVWRAMRTRLTELFAEGASQREALAPLIAPMTDARLHLPCDIGEFTDFYASRFHATAVGTLLRGAENALMPNWVHMPIAYNGRASTVIVSGTDVRRPWGQLRGEQGPRLAPTESLDFELELGVIVGQPIAGPCTADEVREKIFGYLLLNDWSARDIQAWEYQPLGPFQGKAFATSVSPWIVMREALSGAHAPAPERDTALFPYLHEAQPEFHDIRLQAELTTQAGRSTVVTDTNARHLYYSPAQQLAHHALSGCRMRVGDLLGSGTVSGPSPDSAGCLMERTSNGAKPLRIGAEERRFLMDGDRVTLSGHCVVDGGRIGFGVCSAEILPAVEWSI